MRKTQIIALIAGASAYGVVLQETPSQYLLLPLMLVAPVMAYIFAAWTSHNPPGTPERDHSTPPATDAGTKKNNLLPTVKLNVRLPAPGYEFGRFVVGLMLVFWAMMTVFSGASSNPVETLIILAILILPLGLLGARAGARLQTQRLSLIIGLLGMGALVAWFALALYITPDMGDELRRIITRYPLAEAVPYLFSLGLFSFTYLLAASVGFVAIWIVGGRKPGLSHRDLVYQGAVAAALAMIPVVLLLASFMYSIIQQNLTFYGQSFPGSPVPLLISGYAFFVFPAVLAGWALGNFGAWLRRKVSLLPLNPLPSFHSEPLVAQSGE